MRKWITVLLAAGLLTICPSSLRADVTTNSTPNPGQITTDTPGAGKKGLDAKNKGAQRREIIALLGMKRSDLKGLTPEERTSKLKSAADKKIAELETKKAAGSLTDKEESNLTLLKKFERHAHAKKKTDS
jgi:hypothetical protein